MTVPQPPAGQGPVDPRGAFYPPPPPPPQGSAGSAQGFAASGTYQSSPPMMPPPGMPPIMMPPPAYFAPPPPPPPPPQRGSFARGIFMTLATSIFGLSIALNVYLLMISQVVGGGDNLKKNVISDGDPQQKIAVIRINGLIDDGEETKFENTLKQVEPDKSVKALVLEVDTPGGTVTASDEIYSRILRFKKNRGIPVVVSMGGMATSGGYYISCAADSIIAQRTTITGNIGVLLPRYNLTKLADKWGVEDTTLHSTGADFKDSGSMFRPERPEEKAYWLGLIDDAYATFKDVVKTGRGSRLTAPMEIIANGKAYTANESLQMGLIDKTGYPADAYDLAANKAGLTKPQVVRFEQIPSLLSAFGVESKLAPPSASMPPQQGVTTINGVNFNLSSHFLDELATPRLMYLWRGE